LKASKQWYVYLLVNTITKRTYIGCTTDPARRLRQHNSQLVGGAKATTTHWAGHWILHRVLCGFTGRGEAMRWEKILKNRAKGLVNRSHAFHSLAHGKCPKGKTMLPVPKYITLEKL